MQTLISKLVRIVNNNLGNGYPQVIKVIYIYALLCFENTFIGFCNCAYYYKFMRV